MTPGMYMTPAATCPGADWEMRFQFEKRLAEANQASLAQQAAAAVAAQQLQHMTAAALPTADYAAWAALMYKQQQQLAQAYTQDVLLSAEQQKLVCQQILQQRYATMACAQPIPRPPGMGP